MWVRILPLGNSVAVQWLGLCTSAAEGMDSGNQDPTNCPAQPPKIKTLPLPLSNLESITFLKTMVFPDPINEIFLLLSSFLKIIGWPQFPFIEYYVPCAGPCARPFTASPTSQQPHGMGFTAREKLLREARRPAQGLTAGQCRFATRANWVFLWDQSYVVFKYLLLGNKT